MYFLYRNDYKEDFEDKTSSDIKDVHKESEKISRKRPSISTSEAPQSKCKK